jgi:hypothetical protein
LNEPKKQLLLINKVGGSTKEKEATFTLKNNILPPLEYISKNAFSRFIV